MAGPRLKLFPWLASLATLTRSVVSLSRSWTKMSALPLVSPATRLLARDVNATKRPSALMASIPLLLFPWVPSLATLTRSVVSVTRSRTKTSNSSLVSPATRLLASELNATKRPSALMAGKRLCSSPSLPSLATLTRSVVPLSRSWTKTSSSKLMSPATRLLAMDVNATKRPSALMAAPLLSPFSWVPSLATLTRSVVWAWTPVASSNPTPRMAPIRPCRSVIRSPPLGCSCYW